MEWYIYPIVILIGLAAGFINTMAGGGSALSLPMLIIAGLPPTIANGTNRIAILMQNLVGTSQFKKEKVLDLKGSLWLAIPAVIGAVPGAIFAVKLNDQILQYVIGGVLVVMLFIVVFKPDIWIKSRAGIVKSKSSWINILVFFLIGAYGGFIQVGVGFFLLAGLVLVNGLDLLKSNAIKVFIVLLYTIPALFIFIWNKQVDYILGFTLALGNMAGAWLGAKTAVKWGPSFIRYVLIVGLVILAAKLFGVWEAIF
jgi:uncharacterized protein